MCGVEETRRQGEGATRRGGTMRSGAALFLSPCPLVALSPCLCLQHLDYLRVQRRVRGNGVLAVDRRLAGPVGEVAAGFFEDGEHRGAVPEVHGRVEHDVDLA